MTKNNDLAIVKCKECGKEYQLKKGKLLADFQCDCGGDLISERKIKPAIIDGFVKGIIDELIIPDVKKRK